MEEQLRASVVRVLEDLDPKLDRDKVCISSDGSEVELNSYSILQAVLLESKKELVASCTADVNFDRSMGAMCGMAVGDALGHPLEFISASDQPGSSQFSLDELEYHCEFNKFACKRGQWTDDTSMGLCMADSLILRRCFDGSDMRIRFWCWWFRGYNNAFRNDSSRESKKSIGLGGNTQKSLAVLDEFAGGGEVPPVFESACEDAGNGSLMRLAPIPIFLHAASFEELCRIARESSITTHPGFVAAEACALLAYLVRQAIHRAPGPVNAKEFLEAETQEFFAKTLSDKEGPGFDEMKWLVTSTPVRDTERCWNWKHDSLDIASTLAARGWSYNGYPVSADYFGSYSLDGLAGALWAVYHSTSFDDAIVRAVNLCGDADSFGSIAGQLAGALYGYSSIKSEFIDWLTPWDEHEVAVRALLLHQLGVQVRKDES